MGNKNVKETKSNLFSSSQLSAMKKSYGDLETISYEKLLAKWKDSLIDPQLLNFTFIYLFGTEKAGKAINFKQYSELFHVVNHGTIDEKACLIRRSLGEPNSIEELAVKDVKDYVKAVVKSYIAFICSKDSKSEYSSWNKNGYVANENSIQAWTDSFTKPLDNENNKIELKKLEHWLQVNPTFLIIWLKIFASLYGQEENSSNLTAGNIIPLCDGVPTNENYSPIIEIPHVMFLNSLLPIECRHKWRFLFSSKIHGQSFSTMLGKILGKSPTLLIVEDEDKYIFGGYATAKWAVGPKFIGDDNSFLFTLTPVMRFCTTTSYNNHYQYLNLNQQTMPNGLGMGGQFDYWGLWLDCEYGLGHSSESCTTYKDYSQLSAKKDFKIRNLEVWAVGDEPQIDDDDDEETREINGTRSVLDKHLEEKVMLELAGQTMHSEGLRDPDLDK